MNLTQKIEELITLAEGMKTAVGVNKKYLNKCVDRLLDASLYSEKIVLPGSLADRANEYIQTSNIEGCICPMGARSADCPVHGGA